MRFYVTFGRSAATTPGPSWTFSTTITIFIRIFLAGPRTSPAQNSTVSIHQPSALRTDAAPPTLPDLSPIRCQRHFANLRLTGVTSRPICKRAAETMRRQTTGPSASRHQQRHAGETRRGSVPGNTGAAGSSFRRNLAISERISRARCQGNAGARAAPHVGRWNRPHGMPAGPPHSMSRRSSRPVSVAVMNSVTRVPAMLPTTASRLNNCTDRHGGGQVRMLDPCRLWTAFVKQRAMSAPTRRVLAQVTCACARRRSLDALPHRDAVSRFHSRLVSSAPWRHGNAHRYRQRNRCG